MRNLTGWPLSSCPSSVLTAACKSASTANSMALKVSSLTESRKNMDIPRALAIAVTVCKSHFAGSPGEILKILALLALIYKGIGEVSCHHMPITSTSRVLSTRESYPKAEPGEGGDPVEAYGYRESHRPVQFRSSIQSSNRESFSEKTFNPASLHLAA